MSITNHLVNLGWQAYFQQQLSLEEWQNAIPARIVAQHKSEVLVSGNFDTLHLALLASMPKMVVGDWLLLNSEQHFLRLLERKTCFSRKGSGREVQQQLIAANVDTAFIVCSMNDDFNLNRIERYLALVNESQAEAVVVLSKSDLAQEPQRFIDEVQSLGKWLAVEAVNALDTEAVSRLQPWVKTGRTVAVLGSSGVGKSTLINTLMGEQAQLTGAIREDDSKGRHTTTSRALLALSSGGLLLDTPGMREIQLADCDNGLSMTFADIEELANSCRFSDCQHQNEPGCAVNTAVQRGELDERRVHNYVKLRREEALNSASLKEKRAKDKALGKYYKRTMIDSRKLKGR